MAEQRVIPVGPCLNQLANKIATGYPEGTKARVIDVIVEITEPDKPPREIVFLVKGSKKKRG